MTGPKDPKIQRSKDDLCHIGIRIAKSPEWVVEHVADIFTTRKGPFKGEVRPHVYAHHSADEECAHDHTHIYVESDYGSQDADISRYRDRIKKQLGLNGNTDYAISKYSGGFDRFSFYVKHQPTVQVLNATDEQLEMFNSSGAYVKPSKRKRDDDDDDTPINAYRGKEMALTDANIVKVMNHFCRLQRIGVRNFDEVFKRLVRETDWKPSKSLTWYMAREKRIQFENGRDSEQSANSWLDRYLNPPPERMRY